MLKFLKNSVKGDKSAGRTDGCAGAENMAARGLGSKAGTSAKTRSDRWLDRRFERNRCEQIVGFLRKDAGGPQV